MFATENTEIAEGAPQTARRAFLVLGPEGSGTRLWTSILMAAGCTGSAGHQQWWDDHPFTDEDDLVVWRRSYPHDGVWPDVQAMVRRLREDGYRVGALMTMREPAALAGSTVRAGRTETEAAALQRAASAYHDILLDLATMAIWPLAVSFEGLIARPVEVQAWLAGYLALPAAPCVRVKDTNAKYYG